MSCEDYMKIGPLGAEQLPIRRRPFLIGVRTRGSRRIRTVEYNFEDERGSSSYAAKGLKVTRSYKKGQVPILSLKMFLWQIQGL